MKVLVIQIKMIGDVLASTVIFEAIKMKYPNAETHYLIEKNSLAVVENNPNINQILLYEATRYEGIGGFFKLAAEIKSEKYDVVIDAYAKFKTLIPSYLSQSKIRVSSRKWYSKMLMTQTIPDNDIGNGLANLARLKLASVAFNHNFENIYPKIFLSQNQISQAIEQFSVLKSDSKPTIMISVLGSTIEKSLPPAQMARVLDTITKSTDVLLIFNYMPQQYELAKSIYDLCNSHTQSKIIIDFQIKGLQDFIQILSQCDALIGNEGGATNMAKALNVPTFTIYAPWINKTSWNIMEETGDHASVHLSDYFPDIYLKKHPKKLKKNVHELYRKFDHSLFSQELLLFLKRFS